jgi:dephospho-CoA kinase
MTIDERLDRLTERHEALTQSVELLLAAQRQTDESIAKNSIDIADNSAAIGKLTALMAETGQFINRLAHIAEAHDQRIERLEERQGPSAA